MLGGGILKNIKISVRQFQILVFFYTIGTTILIIPTGLAKDAGQDAWIAAILGVALGAVFVWLYVKLGKFMKDMNFIQFSKYALGNVLGTVVSAVYVFFGFIGAATILYYVGKFLTTQIFVNTPIHFIHMLMALTAIMAIRLGIETISRTAEIFFPWFVLLFVIMVAFLMPDARIENMQPVLEAGAKPMFRAAINLMATSTLPLIALFMIFPSNVADRDQLGRAYVSAVVFGGLFIVGISLACIAVLGPEVTARLVFPGYSLAKKVSIGNFLQRVESIFAAIWIIAIFFKLILYFNVCTAGIAQLTGMRDDRPVVLPLGLILVVYGNVVYPNEAYRQEWDSTTWFPYIFTVAIVVPLLLIVGAWLKKLGRRS
jgi:spore germination protein KB